MVKFSEVGVFFKGSGISKDQLSDNGNPCILYGELYTKYKKEVIKEVISKTNLPTKGLVKSQFNDIIIPSSGESAEDIATACCVNVRDVLLGGDLNVIRPHKDNGNFISYQLNGKRKFEIAKIAQGSSVVHLYNEGLKKLNISLPQNVEEQNKIAALLSFMDDRIETQNKIIEKLETLIKGLGEALFCSKLRFPGFNERWQDTTISTECVINPKTQTLNSEFIYIDLESVVKGELIKKVFIKKSAAPSRAQRVLEDYDILFQCVRPYQQNNFLYRKIDAEQAVASTGYAQIRTQHSSAFFYYLLNIPTFNSEVMIRCTGTSYPAISSSDLGEIPISICSLKEQQKIADLLSFVDEKITIEKNIMRQYQKQKKYLLRSLYV